MSCAKRIVSRLFVMLPALSLGAAMVQPGFAAEQPGPSSTASSSKQNATVNLINRLVERGVLSKQDAADLLLMAEADAAEARAQVAMTQAALAQAEAAQARARALAAQLESRRTSGAVAALPSDASASTVVTTEPVASENSASASPARSAPVALMEADAAPVAKAPKARAPAPALASVPAPAPAAEEPVPADVVRVTYIPEVVKAQLREEVKAAVMDQAREENWASPRAFPEWVTRFRVFGDFRFRYEGIKYPTGNFTDFGSSFWNYNAINTGAPYDLTGVANAPAPNVDQNRNRVRIRARLGAAVDLGNAFTVGLRVGTGESNSPVSGNQSLGLPSGGQGGNFSKYATWIDRAFLKYELVGKPDHDYVFSVGRFDNPFFATSMLWADDLGFDGAVIQGKFPVTEDVTPFFTIGAFPVFNTDLNFASNQPTKFKSNDKWLYAAQLGVNMEISKDFAVKVGAAVYEFRNVEGKVSSPFIPLTSADAGDTDASRPAFAQKGNTYVALRDITPSASLNANGTTNQFQYFGLATPFRELAFTAQLEFNRFEPFQVALMGEYVRNQRFDRDAIMHNGPSNLSGPVNNNAVNGTTFGGGNTGWIVNLKIGDAILQKRWDWNVNFGYRKVESDAVVDGFVDSDFGGGGTNLKGFTLNSTLMLSPGVWLGLRWMSAQQIAGPTFKNDTFQMDVNAKF